MKLLIIDTCGATGSVALADPDCQPAIIASAILPGRTASELLVGTIGELSLSSGIGLGSLDAVVVVHGPGSFTGVRVGLSAAKGLCEALGLPLIAISRLAVLAHVANPPPGAPIYALFDAGRGEYYCGIYCDGTRRSEALLTRDQLLAEFGKSALEAVEKLEEENAEVRRLVVTCEAAVAESIAQLAPRLLCEPTAEDALPLALGRMQARDFDDVAMIDANYLRRTDAQIFAKPRPRATPEHRPETSAQ